MKRMKSSTRYIDWTCPTVNKIFNDLENTVRKALNRCGAKTRWAVLEALYNEGCAQIKEQVTYKFRAALDTALVDAEEIIEELQKQQRETNSHLAQVSQELRLYKLRYGELETPKKESNGKFKWIIDEKRIHPASAGEGD